MATDTVSKRAIPKEIQDQLKRIKENVDSFGTYFKKNYDRYNEYRKFIYETSLDKDAKDLLGELKKPVIEFNYGEAYLSRLIGEFGKQEPSIVVSAGEGTKLDPQLKATMDVVEGHMRHILFHANNDSFEVNVYKEILSGGFSSMKVTTDYANPRAFEQDIRIAKCFSATLVGYDQLAEQPHKGDGNYCFELYPKRTAEVKEEWPWLDLSKISYSASNGSYNWAYKANNDPSLLVCDYYEKKKKRTKIYKLADGSVKTQKEYKQYKEDWAARQEIAQPMIVVNERWTELTTICRYRFIANQIIEYKETIYDELPIIFADGNSIVLNEAGAYAQMTRPYLYHAKGIQQLINYAGQSLGGELMNMVQHKWKVAAESINPAFQDAFKDNQLPNVIIYDAFKRDLPNQPIPPPQEIVRQPCPPEITQTFQGGAQIFQNIMGTYDAALGIQNNELSGVAMVEGATQSNAVAMPHVMGFLQALNQAAQNIIKLIPKIFTTPRTIPIRTKDGKMDYVMINQRDAQGNPIGTHIKYGENDLNVKVEAGVNFNIQKTRTLAQIGQMMSASNGPGPSFADFINKKCLPVLVKNMDLRGQDELVVLADEYVAENKQAQMQQQKMAATQMQNNPMMIKARADMMKAQADQARVQNERIEMMTQAKQAQDEGQYRAAEIMDKAQATQNDRMEILLNAHIAHADQAIQLKKADAEKFNDETEIALKVEHQAHTHLKDKAHFEHQLIQANKPEESTTNEQSTAAGS